MQLGYCGEDCSTRIFNFDLKSALPPAIDQFRDQRNGTLIIDLALVGRKAVYKMIMLSVSYNSLCDDLVSTGLYS